MNCGCADTVKGVDYKTPASDIRVKQHKPLFVSFEGGDGTGKSTQIKLLARWLEESGAQVVVTNEPGGTRLGQVLRKEVMHGEEVSAKTEALLYATDRAHHVDTVVKPSLAEGKWVITDRYLDSSVAYQGQGRGLEPQEIENLSLWATDGLLPDITFLLDIDPREGLKRVSAREGELDRIEKASLDFHERARGMFLERAKKDPERWFVLDATKAVEEISLLVSERVIDKITTL